MQTYVLPPKIIAVASALRALTVPWAIAGGWAIDLALGRVTRSHHDVDVAVFRPDQATLRADLVDWTFEMVRDGARLPWPAGVVLEPQIFEAYGHPPDTDPASEIELLFDERAGEDWVYRRDTAVRRPLQLVLRSSEAAIRFLAPEITLLYKSKAPRTEDEHDFAVALELLDAEARAWLRTAIARNESGHPWVIRLAEGQMTNEAFRRPATDEEWAAYHAIRKRVLFDLRGEGPEYDAGHADEHRPKHHPFVLWEGGVPVGVIRIDVNGKLAVFRRVAVRDDLQRRGHGRRLLQAAERFASEQGCTHIESHVDPRAVEFYERCGFSRVAPTAGSDAMLMSKALC